MNKVINIYNYSGYGMYMKVKYQDDTMDSIAQVGPMTDLIPNGGMTKITIPYTSTNVSSYEAYLKASTSSMYFEDKKIIDSSMNSVNNNMNSMDMIIYYYPNITSSTGTNYSSYPLSGFSSVNVDGYMIKDDKKYPTSCAVNSSINQATIMMLLNSNASALQPKIDIDSYQTSTSCNDLKPVSNANGSGNANVSGSNSTTLDDGDDNSKTYFYIIFVLVIVVIIMLAIGGFVYYKKFHKK